MLSVFSAVPANAAPTTPNTVPTPGRELTLQEKTNLEALFGATTAGSHVVFFAL